LADKFEAENILEGEIREVRFLGNTREYVIQLTNGDRVVSRRFLEGKNPAFGTGQRIYVSFEKRDVMTFAYPSEGLRKELEMV
jgi:hypothetical protein